MLPNHVKSCVTWLCGDCLLVVDLLRFRTRCRVFNLVFLYCLIGDHQHNDTWLWEMYVLYFPFSARVFLPFLFMVAIVYSMCACLQELPSLDNGFVSPSELEGFPADLHHGHRDCLRKLGLDFFSR